MTTINKITQDDIDNLKVFQTLNQYQKSASRSAIYPGQGTSLGLVYVALKLNGEAGEFAEHVGKAMRDDSFMSSVRSVNGIGIEFEEEVDLTEARRDVLIKEAGDVLWYLSAACNELGIDLLEVAITNLEKLKSRTDRGQLQGSGDNR